MLDIWFYRAGCQGTSPIQRLKAFPRRVLRRILEPIFFQQVELYRNLFDRLYQKECEVDELREVIETLKGVNKQLEERMELVDERNETALAMGWDHVAMMRRMAVLEDHVASLTGSSLASSDDSDPVSSILFPGLENIARASAARKRLPELKGDVEACSKVC